MPETVELYGVTWELSLMGSLVVWDGRRAGINTLFIPSSKELALESSGGYVNYPCPTLERAAMIVALLARPDAQFGLVEKEGGDESP